MSKKEKFSEVVKRYWFEEGYAESEEFKRDMEVASFRKQFDKALGVEIEKYVDMFIDRTYTDEDEDNAIYLMDKDVRFRERFVPIIYLEGKLEEARLAILAVQNKMAIKKLMESQEVKNDDEETE